MQCEEVREQLTGHVAHELREPVRGQVAEHLSTCESCCAEAEELKTVWAEMASIPAEQPSPDARARFDLMMKAYQQGIDQASTPSLWHGINRWLGNWWPRQPVFQFGIGLALLVIGILAGYRFPAAQQPVNRESGAEIAELRGELAGMRQMVAVSLMQHDSASDRLRGVNWSYQLQQPGEEVLTTLLDTLMHDSNVNVRLATVDALRQFGNQEIVRKGVIEAMRKQQSPIVQVALIDLAVDLKDKGSVPALKELSQDQAVDMAVRERAQKGLSQLE